MGIRFNRNSWRAPLRLIDSLLPQPAASVRVDSSPLNRTTEAFARAGWLGRGRTPATPKLAGNASASSGSEDTKPAPCRLVASHGKRLDLRHPASEAPSSAHVNAPIAIVRGARVKLAGRIDAVCAELERLAALEESASLPRAA